MVRCRPYYLPGELTSVIVTNVYAPPDANAKLAMKEIQAAISKQQTTQPLLLTCDFNHSNLKTVLPRFHQHVSCHTRGDKTLDHVYSNRLGACRMKPLPHKRTVRSPFSPPQLLTSHPSCETYSENNKSMAYGNRLCCETGSSS